MLSICIPVYNFNVVKLVTELYNQATQLQINFEIICIDDCSELNFKHQNKPITGLRQVNYIELNENIGRSKIRNLFLKHVSYSYLLFLDCDALISSPFFIQNYIDAIHADTQVVCGGLTYNNKKPARKYQLRWKYGIKKEVISFEKRISNPYKSFNTINFLISKNTFEQIQFDERVTGYGHEDTLFGFQLKTQRITIQHINNPVINESIETNEEFLYKTEQAIRNLVYIQNNITLSSDLTEEISLLAIFNWVQKKKMLFAVRTFWFTFGPIIKKMLISGFAIIPLFSFYKLGYLIYYKNKLS